MDTVSGAYSDTDNGADLDTCIHSLTDSETISNMVDPTETFGIGVFKHVSQDTFFHVTSNSRILA
jgi:hypothetical protein